MTKDDLVNNLGVIFNSGASKFLDSTKDGPADVSQNGQFDVGVYSSFLISCRMRIFSTYVDEDVQHIWERKNR